MYNRFLHARKITYATDAIAMLHYVGTLQNVGQIEHPNLCYVGQRYFE